MFVNRAGDEFLSRASLTEQQHRGITGRDCLDQLQHLPECRAIADDLIEVQLAAYLFFEIKLLLVQLVFESGNLLPRKGVLQRKCYLTRNRNQEIKLILSVRIMLSPNQTKRAHKAVVACKWQHASCVELFIEQKFILKTRTSLIASPDPRLTRPQYMAGNRPSERSCFREAAPFRSKVERIDIKFVFLWASQKNADTVGD